MRGLGENQSFPDSREPAQQTEILIPDNEQRSTAKFQSEKSKHLLRKRRKFNVLVSVQ